MREADGALHTPAGIRSAKHEKENVMSTTTLTGQDFEPTMAGGGIVLVDGVRALDLDAIHAQLAREHQPA